MRSNEGYVGINPRWPEKEMWVGEERKGFRETWGPRSGDKNLSNRSKEHKVGNISGTPFQSISRCHNEYPSLSNLQTKVI